MKQVLLIVLSCLFTLSLLAQKQKTKKADALYDKLSYLKAADLYIKAVEKGNDEPRLLRRIGDAYYYNAKMEDAVVWYEKLAAQQGDNMDVQYMFRYAHALQGSQQPLKAEKWMTKFSDAVENDEILKKNFKRTTIAEVTQKRVNFELYNLPVNTEYSEFGSAIYADRLVFTSDRPKSKTDKELNPWTQTPYSNMWYGKIEENRKDVFDAKLFARKATTEVNESTPVFTKNFRTMYFTRNNFTFRKKSDKEGTTRLKLYRAEAEVKGKEINWKAIKELPFNSDEYSVGHPALSKDESKLFFASDMPGTIGMSDIFYVDIKSDGSYSEPVNIGKKINTEARETMPVIKGDTLYFATTGRVGFGGLDIFYTVMKGDKFSTPVNAGAPFNSNDDDFALVFSKDGKSGFLTSNRNGGKGADDIYAFAEIPPPPCVQRVKGTVINKFNGQRIADVKLVLRDSIGKVLKNITSNSKGEYDFAVKMHCSEKVRIDAAKEGYSSAKKYAVTEDVNGETFVPIVLEPNDEIIIRDNGIIKLDLDIIYFDFDKDNIRPDAALELDKIVRIMKKYPKMEINIESHTDSRAPFEYNRDLSDRRAKSTRRYILANGIEDYRIRSAKGYGESRLVNECSDGVSCTEEAHQLNRRSEFIVLRIE